MTVLTLLILMTPLTIQSTDDSSDSNISPNHSLDPANSNYEYSDLTNSTNDYTASTDTYNAPTNSTDNTNDPNGHT